MRLGWRQGCEQFEASTSHFYVAHFRQCSEAPLNYAFIFRFTKTLKNSGMLHVDLIVDMTPRGSNTTGARHAKNSNACGDRRGHSVHVLLIAYHINPVKDA